jgi:hypothetical protein
MSRLRERNPLALIITACAQRLLLALGDGDAGKNVLAAGSQGTCFPFAR